jgi:DNA-directed RNA polymerase subunit RPC12/RpoP
MKRCSKCGEVKPLEDFHVKRIAEDGRQVKCKDCSRVIAKERYATKLRFNTTDEKRSRHLKTKYRLTLDDYNALLIRQGYVCAICGQDDNGRELSVDHCHSTNKVRGLLCHNCNVGIGHFKDNQNLLLLAIDYLRKYE